MRWFRRERDTLAVGILACAAGLALLAPCSSGAGAQAAAPEAVLKAESERIAAMDKARPGLLAIFGRGGRGGGSGVVISPDGYALSNFHVTRGAGNAMKCGMPDGKLYDAVIVGLDPTGDVALLKVLGRDDFPHAELGDSDQVRVGDWCFAMGNPFLLATDFQPTVTYGIVSGVRRYQYPAGSILEYADCIQTDASINPGNSGGPLFDAAGRLIGINGRGSFEKRGRVNVGVGYAISINQIKRFLGCLKSGRIVDHASAGVRVSADEDGRVIVADILEDCDAFRRGLRYDDEVVFFGDRRIRTTNQFLNALGVFPKAWRVPLVYRRDGKDVETLVRLGGLHRAGELERVVSGGRPGAPKPKKPKPEEPKPEQPDPDEPKPDEPKPDKPKPKPVPIRPGKAPAPMPAVVKKVYEARRGYANYYFNRLNQKRVWDAFVKQSGDFSKLDGRWVLRGETDQGAVEFSLGDKRASSKLPLGDSRIDTSADLNQAADPPGSGGLLAALALWRRLLQTGIDDFVGADKLGDLYYHGTAPWPGQEGLLDVMVGAVAGVEGRFLFDPASGHLVALEMFRDTTLDPCEVDFGDYREVDGRFWPHEISVRYGDIRFGTFKLKEFAVEPVVDANDAAEDGAT